MDVNSIISFMQWRGISLVDIQEMDMPHLKVKKYYLFGKNSNGTFENMMISENLEDDKYSIKVDHYVGSKHHNYSTWSSSGGPNFDKNYFQEVYKEELRDYMISTIIK